MKTELLKGSSTFVDVALGLGIVLFLIDLFTANVLLFFVSSLFLVFGLYPRLYLKHVAKRFFYDNERKKISVTKGDDGEWLFRFINKANLPVLGTCQFSHDSVFQFDQGKKTQDQRYEFSISVQRKQSLELALPFSTVARGVGRLHDLRLTLSDPLKLMTVQIRYEFVRSEVVVYPKRQAVSGLESAHLLQEGGHANRNSLFYDRSLPIGTRDYTQGDSLKAIHWKATARKGALQTKLVEKTMGLTWSFVVLIGSSMQKEDVEKLEDQLSSFARLAEMAHRRGIDFDLSINTKPMGKALILHTMLGNDRPHYFRIMERLALIQVNFLRVDPKLAIREMTKNFTQPRVVFFAGAFKEIASDPILSLWQKRGLKLYEVEETGTLTPIRKGGVKVAD